MGDKLHKEYGLVDLSRYKEGKLGIRWRTENEVLIGRGHFSCGNKRCSETNGLQSFEVPFRYKEHNEQKMALIKLRMCKDCGYKLNYKNNKKKLKKAEKDIKR